MIGIPITIERAPDFLSMTREQFARAEIALASAPRPRQVSAKDLARRRAAAKRARKARRIARR